MNSRRLSVLMVVVGLAAAGLGLRWLEAPAWRELRAQEPAWQLGLADGAVGQGLTLGLLGGFRALVADMAWLRTNLAWERRDLATTRTWLRLTTAMDPRPLTFWLNGARMLAYDMPSWRMAEAAARNGAVTEAEWRAIREEQAQLALAHLAEAQRFHAERSALAIEAGNLHLNQRGDVAAAAAAYREAAGRSDAPYYAARIHAELLRRLGRNTEALAWLREHYTGLPGAPGVERPTGMTEREWAWRVEQAMAPVVRARIRELEASRADSPRP